MAEYKTYPIYKDSKVQWLGIVPDHWEIKRLGNIFEERRLKVSDKDFPALSVTKNGIVSQLDSAAKTNDGDNRKGVFKGDFVINSRSDRKGSSGIAKQDGSVSLINIVLKPCEIIPVYSEYLLKSYQFIEEFYHYGHGIVADLWTTRFTEMKTMFLPLPPIFEQTAIANFLDRKTSEIAGFIALKEKTITLLKERKIAIINKAVTKGLDDTAPMKDSGIGWLGEIPANWEVKRLKYVSKINPSKGNSIYNKNSKEDAVFLPMERVSADGIISNDIKKPIKELWVGFTYFERNDIVLAKITPCFENGKGAYLNKLETKIGFGTTEFHVFRANKQIIVPEFLQYILRSEMFMTLGEENMVGSAGQKRVPTSFVSNYIAAIPPLNEQKLINNHIQSQAILLDQSIAQAEKEISLIKEFQQNLISEAVTGKIDVRENIAEKEQALSMVADANAVYEKTR